MQNPMETLFSTCQELLGKKARTYAEFVKECEKDKVLGEGVNAVCHAMMRFSEAYRQQLQDVLVPQNVTRVEVIDQDGRSYTNHHKDNKVELSFQDNDRTLKVFLTRPPLDS